MVSIFFANITSFSEKAQHYIASRRDDVILLAETHQDLAKTAVMTKTLGSLGWQCTASPAQQSDKSLSGTVGGVLAGAKHYLDNRPLSICVDHAGSRTRNAFITGRFVTMHGLKFNALQVISKAEV